MKCLAWNCRGIMRKEIPSNFNFLCSLTNLDLFCLMEIKMAIDKVPRNFYSEYIDNVFCCDPVDRTGGLCLCWNASKVDINIISSSPRFIHCFVKDLISNQDQVVIFPYAFPHAKTYAMLSLGGCLKVGLYR